MNSIKQWSLPGWTCGCGIFNGCMKEYLSVCRVCGAQAPPVPDELRAILREVMGKEFGQWFDNQSEENKASIDAIVQLDKQSVVDEKFTCHCGIVTTVKNSRIAVHNSFKGAGRITRRCPWSGMNYPPAFGHAPEEPSDVRDQWSDAVDAAHPTRGGSHAVYNIASRMVSSRYSKGALIDLVNWLLAHPPLPVRAIPALPEATLVECVRGLQALYVRFDADALAFAKGDDANRPACREMQSASFYVRQAAKCVERATGVNQAETQHFPECPSLRGEACFCMPKP